MRRATHRRLTQPPGEWVTLAPSEREEVNAALAALRAEVRRLRKAVVELLKANAFGMSVTRGWEDAHIDPLYLQCAAADHRGRAALAPRKTRGAK